MTFLIVFIIFFQYVNLLDVIIPHNSIVRKIWVVTALVFTSYHFEQRS